MTTASTDEQKVEPSDVDKWLLSSIHDYLKFSNLHHTAECLESERFTLDHEQNTGAGSFSQEGGQGAQNVRGMVRERVLSAFHSGKHDNFISLWYTHIPSKLLEQPNSRMLELNIRVYLALFHLRASNESAQGQHDNHSLGYIDSHRHMDDLREFLDKYSSVLAVLPQALPYYALPFVDDPRRHPSFSRVFSEGWKRDLRHDLEDFLAIALRDASLPALYGLWAQSREQDERITFMRQASRALFSCAVEMIKVLEDVRKVQQEKKTPEKRTKAEFVEISRDFIMRMKTELNNCGKQLIGAATDHASSADVVTGELRDADFYQEELSGGTYQEQELASSGMAEVTNSSQQDLKQSTAATPATDNSQMWNTHSELVDVTLGPRDALRSNRISSRDGRFRDDPISTNLQKQYLLEEPIMPALDYASMRVDLRAWSISASKKAGGKSERSACLLLQALRWRISRCPAGAARKRVVETMVKHDILGAKQHHQNAADGDLLSVLMSSSPLVIEYTCRLVSWLSAHVQGRTYLLKVPTLLDSLGELVRNGERDSPAWCNALAGLQKLSLRRVAQAKLVRLGFAEVCVFLLHQHLQSIQHKSKAASVPLSQFALEYITAMLMNICLRASGKRRAVATTDMSGGGGQQVDVLATLQPLLRCSDVQVRTCVHGTLYSLLEMPAFRQAARESNLETELHALLNDNKTLPMLQRQLKYILELLNSASGEGKSNEDFEVDEDEALREIENERDDEKDDQEPETRPDEVPEPDDAEHETLQKQNLLSVPTGEAFLVDRYLKERSDNSHAVLDDSKAFDNHGSTEDEASSSDEDEARKAHTPLNGYDEIDMPDEMKKKDKIPRTPPWSSHGRNGDEANSMAWTPRSLDKAVNWPDNGDSKDAISGDVKRETNSRERSSVEDKRSEVEDEEVVAFETKPKVPRTPEFVSRNGLQTPELLSSRTGTPDFVSDSAGRLNYSDSIDGGNGYVGYDEHGEGKYAN